MFSIFIEFMNFKWYSQNKFTKKFDIQNVSIDIILMINKI